MVLPPFFILWPSWGLSLEVKLSQSLFTMHNHNTQQPFEGGGYFQGAVFAVFTVIKQSLNSYDVEQWKTIYNFENSSLVTFCVNI